jgi:tetratricopeptide (TPR) repeat protein
VAKFAYKASDAQGKEQFGVVEAASENDAANEVGRQGLYVLSIRPAGLGDEWRAKRQKREAAQGESDSKRSRPRQRLVAHFRDGRVRYGTSLTLNPKEHNFRLEMAEPDGTPKGEAAQIRYSELKAVFYVKSFDGNFDRDEQHREWMPEGNEVVAVFQDGEAIRGSTVHHYDPDEERFYLVPSDPRTNNISILVESKALEGVYAPEEYERIKQEKERQRKQQTPKEELSQDETMGDFYFDTRDYDSALKHYAAATEQFPQSHRLRRKLLAAEYNIGVQHIRRRAYGEALQWMERVLKRDPDNRHALKKKKQLRKILDKAPESANQRSAG